MFCILEARAGMSCEGSLPRSSDTAFSKWRYCYVSDSPDGSGPALLTLCAALAPSLRDGVEVEKVSQVK